MTVEAERERIEALRACCILDTPPDPELQTLVDHAARLVQAPISVISLVDEARQWFAAAHGNVGSETPRSISFCTHTIEQREPMIVRDARQDSRFVNNPLVTGDPNIVFYAGWPLVTSDGHALGSLCVIDHQVRHLTPTQCEGMELLARQVVISLELRRAAFRGASVASPIAELVTRREEAERELANRSQLARLVAHDLKNPLTAIAGNVSYVLESNTLAHDERVALLDVVAAAARMQGLLLDLVDVTRALEPDGRLAVQRKRISCRDLVERVVGNGQSHAFESHVNIEVDPGIRAEVDPRSIARVLCNLVDNARRYAPRDTAIVITWRDMGANSELVVADEGPGVRDIDKERIFEPYVQLGAQPSGRGLGLVFCKLAVEAHGGTIRVMDNQPRGACFCVTLPNPARERRATTRTVDIQW
ncbi:MAG: GAF domain-containing sensor histidine kinase [Kofleriaceae bacterium]